MRGRSPRTTRSAPLSQTWALLPCRTSASISWLKCISRKSSHPPTIEFVDIAGLVKGASKGEGLGNKFLSHIREVDAMVHVVRCFEDDNIIHVDGSVDPARDIETINLELILSDIEMLERRIDKAKKMPSRRTRSSAERAGASYETYTRLTWMRASQPAAVSVMTTRKRELLASVIPADERSRSSTPPTYQRDPTLRNGIENNRRLSAAVKQDRRRASTLAGACRSAPEIEAEIAGMDPRGKGTFPRRTWVMTESGLDRLINACYSPARSHLLPDRRPSPRCAPGRS